MQVSNYKKHHSFVQELQEIKSIRISVFVEPKFVAIQQTVNVCEISSFSIKKCWINHIKGKNLCSLLVENVIKHIIERGNQGSYNMWENRFHKCVSGS